MQSREPVLIEKPEVSVVFTLPEKPGKLNSTAVALKGAKQMINDENNIVLILLVIDIILYSPVINIIKRKN